MRQKEGFELSFVSILPLVTKVEIIIDARNQEVGNYQIVLESYDRLSSVQSTLKTDIISLTIEYTAP